MAVWLVSIVVLLSLFTYIDVWYFIRFILLYILIRLKKRNGCATLTREELLKEYVTRGVVLPSDLDFNLHMNNSKYLRELDFARVGMYFEKGIRNVLLSRGAVCLVNAINVRYRRPLQLLQSFQVNTRVIGWEEKAMYLEQRIVTDDGFVAAIAHVKMAIRGITTNELMRSLCGRQISTPLISGELKAWQESINLSSKHLREENTLHSPPPITNNNNNTASAKLNTKRKTL